MLGCASLKYLQGDSMLVTMSFGDRVLRNVTISGIISLIPGEGLKKII